jgi:hypothetical protein
LLCGRFSSPFFFRRVRFLPLAMLLLPGVVALLIFIRVAHRIARDFGEVSQATPEGSSPPGHPRRFALAALFRGVLYSDATAQHIA